MVEFALTLPLFLFMLFAIIEGGRLLFSYSLVTASAREAARWAAASDNFTDCSGIIAAATRIGNFAGVNPANTNATFAIKYIISGTETAVHANGSGKCVNSGGADISGNIEAGDSIKVVITISNVTPLTGIIKFPSGMSISSENTRTIIHDVEVTEIEP